MPAAMPGLHEVALTSSVPMNDLQRRYLAVRADVEPAMLAALSSGMWLNGEYSRNFARDFAASVDCSDCILVANGTDALELALRSVMQVKPGHGREVVTVANAGGYTTIACRQLGLTPVYADIEETSLLMSIPSAVAALTENTAAIVATHLYGGVVDVVAVREAIAAAGYGHVAIIEDCAQAHGAMAGTAPVGSMGDIATFSFYPTKNLGAFGDAGAIVSSDRELTAAARRLHQYGWSSKYSVDTSGGRNSRMDEVQAAVLGRLLPRLPEWNARRRQIIDQYRGHAAAKLRFIDGGAGSVAHLAVACCDDRAAFRTFMSNRGIATDIHYPILDCDQAGWADLPMRIGPSGLEQSRRAVAGIVTLPCFPEMTEAEIAQVCAALAEWSRP